jgi:hypothetical protein
MKKLLLTAAFGCASLVAATTSVRAQSTTIVGWNFENDSIATNNSPLASTNAVLSGTYSADAIGMGTYATPNVGVNTDDVLAGKSTDTGANSLADLTHEWRIRGQAGTNGAANGWSSLAPIGAQGAQFFASTAGYASASYNSLLISFDWYSTTQGEANLELEYTTDGGSTWNDLPITLGASDAAASILTGTSTDTNTTQGSYLSDSILNSANPNAASDAGQDWFTNLTATISDPNAFNNSQFGIEMVNASTGADCVSTQGTALNNSSGNWRFDNVSISAQAVPEPSTYGVVALGAAMLMLASKRVRRFRRA